MRSSVGAVGPPMLVLLAGLTLEGSVRAAEPFDASVLHDTLIYDDLEVDASYSLSHDGSNWLNPYGLGEMDAAYHGQLRDRDEGHTGHRGP